MNLDEIIKSRHSIRDYKEDIVSNNLIGAILDSAKQAPSSDNIQNWRFIIVKDKKKKEQIARASLNQSWMNQAPVHIVVCYDVRQVKTLFPESYIELSIKNVSIASTLIMLKATELSLGSCWVDIADQIKISQILKLPEHIIPSVIITIGYASGYYKKTTRLGLDIITFFEEFGSRGRRLHPKLLPLQTQSLKQKLDKLKTKLKK